MQKIRIKSIDLFIHRYDRNPIVADLQHQVQKLSLKSGGSSTGGAISTVVVSVRQDDGSTKNVPVDVGETIKAVHQHTEEIKNINNAIVNMDGYTWKEV